MREVIARGGVLFAVFNRSIACETADAGRQCCNFSARAGGGGDGSASPNGRKQM